MAKSAAQLSAEKAWEVASKAEPKLAALLEDVLVRFKGSTKLGTVEAYISSGDLSGLLTYLNVNLTRAVADVELIASLDIAVWTAGKDAEAAVNSALAAQGKTLATQIPGTFATAQVVLSDPARFGFSMTNPKTIQAVRQWQGQLIQQMALNARTATVAIIEDGLIKGQNPRTVARAVREGLGLTSTQAGHVASFQAELDRIAANGIRSAQSWGIYTPKQIAELKVRDPALFKYLQFSGNEQKVGRKTGKLTRASGTQRITTGAVKDTKGIRAQGGATAYRIGPDGQPLDGMTSWRLRSRKKYDHLIFDGVQTHEKRMAVQAELESVKSDLYKIKTQQPWLKGTDLEKSLLKRQQRLVPALQKAKAAEASALKNIEAVKKLMVEGYQGRYIKHRSQVIARTEAMRAANLGSYEAWRQLFEDDDLFDQDEVQREWATAMDDRVRPDHRGAKGQRVGMNEPFTVGGQKVMFPPHQPNCRCAVLYRIV